MQSVPQGGSGVLTIPRPPSSGVTFDIQLEQGTALLASAIAGSAGAGAAAHVMSAHAAPVPPPSAVARVASPAESARLGVRVPSVAEPGVRSPGFDPSGPGARLQTRLVLTTVEPPPDPDARRPGSAT